MFLDTVEEQFGSRNLYAVLGVEKTAEEAEVRRAYRRLSLKVHPDRAAPDEVASATERFQVCIRHAMRVATICKALCSHIKASALSAVHLLLIFNIIV